MDIFHLGTLSGSVVKNPPANAGALGLIPGLGRSPGRKKWQPTPIFLPGKSHAQRNLAGHSPWSHKESYMTEHARPYMSRVIGEKELHV